MAFRCVKEEQARWEKWEGVRWPFVKRAARREQEKGGVWVEAGMKVGMEEGEKILIRAASGSPRSSLSSLWAWEGRGALRHCVPFWAVVTCFCVINSVVQSERVWR